MHLSVPTGEPDDVALLAEVKAGVRASLDRLIRRYNQQLYRIARAQLGSDDEAEDLTQHAWVQILSALHQWEGRGPFGAWAATIVVNACRKKHRASLNAEPVEEASPPPSPDEEALRVQIRQVLERNVDELPATLRTVLVMRDVEGFSGGEVAGILGITEALVRVRLHRARQALRQSLDAQFAGEGRALYPFLGSRCDRMTQAVLSRVSGMFDA